VFRFCDVLIGLCYDVVLVLCVCMRETVVLWLFGVVISAELCLVLIVLCLLTVARCVWTLVVNMELLCVVWLRFFSAVRFCSCSVCVLQV